MSDLGEALKKNLADTFAFYLKSHNYHWNVEGPDFYEYHQFFELLYNETWNAVDAIAEHIRTLDEYAPGSFGRFSELTKIPDATTIPTGIKMASTLLADNEKVIDNLKISQQLAEKVKEVGIGNFLQDRIDIHSKHGWMLRSTIKNR